MPDGVICPKEALKVLKCSFWLRNNSRMYKSNPTWGCFQLQRGNETEIASHWCTINVCLLWLLDTHFSPEILLVHRECLLLQHKLPNGRGQGGKEGERRMHNISDNTEQRAEFSALQRFTFLMCLFFIIFIHKQGNTSETLLSNLWYGISSAAAVRLCSWLRDWITSLGRTSDA